MEPAAPVTLPPAAAVIAVNTDARCRPLPKSLVLNDLRQLRDLRCVLLIDRLRSFGIERCTSTVSFRRTVRNERARLIDEVASDIEPGLNLVLIEIGASAPPVFDVSRLVLATVSSMFFGAAAVSRCR
jgi:hypothetical protein